MEGNVILKLVIVAESGLGTATVWLLPKLNKKCSFRFPFDHQRRSDG